MTVVALGPHSLSGLTIQIETNAVPGETCDPFGIRSLHEQPLALDAMTDQDWRESSDEDHPTLPPTYGFSSEGALSGAESASITSRPIPRERLPAVLAYPRSH